MASVSTPQETDLIERMNRIRNASEEHVAQFHHEVERLKDWREHVRAQPLLAVGASFVAGYLVVSKLSRPHNKSVKVHTSSGHSGPRSPRNEDNSHEERVAEVAATTSLTAGAMALLGSLASSAVRMAATHYLRNALDKRTGRDS